MTLPELLYLQVRPLLLAIYRFQLRFKLNSIERHLDSIEKSIANDRAAQRYLWREQMTVKRELNSLK